MAGHVCCEDILEHDCAERNVVGIVKVRNQLNLCVQHQLKCPAAMVILQHGPGTVKGMSFCLPFLKGNTLRHCPFPHDKNRLILSRA